MSDWIDPLTGKAATPGGIAAVTQETLLAGERNQDSETNSYLVTRAEVNKTVVTADGVISAAPAHLVGIHVNSVGTGINLHDHASAAAGESIDFATTAVGCQGLGGFVRMNNGIYANITGGEVIVLWRPQ